MDQRGPDIRSHELSPGTDRELPLLDRAGAIELLREARRIAVVGASSLPWRASNSVMRYLLDQDYDCVPVNPRRREVLGRACYASLEDAVADGGPFDIVDVFRRPMATPDVARAAVATDSRALWLQQGIINLEAARIATDAGLLVVMDRCTAALHRSLRS